MLLCALALPTICVLMLSLIGTPQIIFLPNPSCMWRCLMFLRQRLLLRDVGCVEIESILGFSVSCLCLLSNPRILG
jgi:hypothetical protein